jgi:DUF2075 family protein
MFHVINQSELPSNSGIAVEYRVHGRQQRIDFIVSGLSAQGLSQLVVVELKQWSEVQPSNLRDHVSTFVGGAVRPLVHPSYQAWTYASLMRDFYTFVSSDPIVVQACAYLHNCHDDRPLRLPQYHDLLEKAPVFARGQGDQLARFLEECIEVGDGGDVIRRMESSPVAPSRQLSDAIKSMLDGNEEFKLIDEQKTAFETIRDLVSRTQSEGRAAVVVRGGPGTGKSVIAINALVEFLGAGLNVRYVTKNAAPRAVYQERLRGKSKDTAVSNLFVSSDRFVDAADLEYDVLLVDEAHRLAAGSGFYGNLGGSQVAQVLRSSRISVFLVDESQMVTWRDVGSLDAITAAIRGSGVPLHELELVTQFRCAGSNEYLRWVDWILGVVEVEPPDLSSCEYDIRIFESPTEMRDEIVQMNEEVGSSRLLAGYCWDWRSRRDSSAFDIEFPEWNFKMRWNLTSDGAGWMSVPSSINEVGCIHTCQGLEGDFMGVIVGPDVKVSHATLSGDPFGRSKDDKSLVGWKAAVKRSEPGAFARAERLVRNTYRTLLTRGMRGTFLYCTDGQVAEFLRNSLDACGYQSRTAKP